MGKKHLFSLGRLSNEGSNNLCEAHLGFLLTKGPGLFVMPEDRGKIVPLFEHSKAVGTGLERYRYSLSSAAPDGYDHTRELGFTFGGPTHPTYKLTEIYEYYSSTHDDWSYYPSKNVKADGLAIQNDGKPAFLLVAPSVMAAAPWTPWYWFVPRSGPLVSDYSTQFAPSSATKKTLGLLAMAHTKPSGDYKLLSRFHTGNGHDTWAFKQEDLPSFLAPISGVGTQGDPEKQIWVSPNANAGNQLVRREYRPTAVSPASVWFWTSEFQKLDSTLVVEQNGPKGQFNDHPLGSVEPSEGRDLKPLWMLITVDNAPPPEKSDWDKFWDGVANFLTLPFKIIAELAEGIGTIITTINDVVTDAVVGIFDFFLDAFCAGGDVGCAIGNIFLGAAKGIVNGVRDTINQGAKSITAGARAVESLSRFDPKGFFQNVIISAEEGITGVITGVRTGLGISAFEGIGAAFDHHALVEYVRDLIHINFKESDRDRIAKGIGLDRSSLNLDLPVDHYIASVDTLVSPVDQWHRSGVIDLKQIAHVDPANSLVGQRTVVVRSEDGKPATSAEIDSYLSVGSPRLTLIAASPSAVKASETTAVAAYKNIGINLKFHSQSLQLHDPDDVKYDVDKNPLTRLAQLGLTLANQRPRRVIALLTFGVHGHEDGDHSGHAVPTVGNAQLVVHKDRSLGSLADYVLAHELGHYFSLTHDSAMNNLANIMVTGPGLDVGKAVGSMLTFGTLVNGVKPRFSAQQARDVWATIVTTYPWLLTG